MQFIKPVKWFYFFFILNLISHTALGSQSFLLFEPGFSTPNYYVDHDPVFGLYINGILVNSGDNLVLDTGEVIAYKRLLGHGQNTIIILDQSNKAYRLTQFIDERAMTMFQGYMETYFLLLQHLPSQSLVHLDPDFQPRSSYVMIVEWLPLEDLLSNYFDPTSSLTSAQNSYVMSDTKYNKLVDFFESFRGISYLGDFTAQQIGYIKNRGWVLFDYGVGLRFSTHQKPESTDILKIKQLTDSLHPSLINRLRQSLTERDQTFYSNQKQNSCTNYLMN